MEGKLFSIGHSTHTIEEFISLLKRHDISCIVDVRSIPFSEHTPQFNEILLKKSLAQSNIYYLPFGEFFGARRLDSTIDGQVNFEKAVRTPAFLKGYQRVLSGLQKGLRICFMCSEAEPLACHRFSLVSRYFYDNGYEVNHILKDGSRATHACLEKEMIDEYVKKKKLSEEDAMFGTYTFDDQRIDAYRIKNKEIGYKIPEQ